VLTRSAGAQRVLGPGDDGWPIPAGVLRFGLSSRFLSANERFNAGGNRELLGTPYAGLLGANAFSSLVTLQDDVRAASGVHEFTATLGVARSNLRPSSAVIPLELALGLGHRLTARVVGTFFTGAQESQWGLDASGATVGVNPAAANAGLAQANETLLNALDTAAAQLQRLADGCAANPLSDSRCASVIANNNSVRALLDRAHNTTNELAHTYGGRAGVPASSFVPISGTSADSGVAARIAALRSDFNSYGTPSVADGAKPAGARTPPTITELLTLLSDSTYGYAPGAMNRQYGQGFGDIDVGVMMVMFDHLGANGPWTRDSVTHVAFRQSVGFTYRLGTGTPPDPDNPLALPTGDGQNDLEFVSATDVAINNHFWGSMIARYTLQQSRDGIARIPDASGSVFVPFARRRMARADLGDRVELALSPRWVLNDWFAVGIGWHWTHQQGKHIEELAPPAGATPMAYTGPAQSSHELAAGLTWSSVAAWRRNRARWPLEIQWDKSMVVAGTGNATRFSADRISVRAYAKLWGR
jgi:hypothetical protein